VIGALILAGAAVLLTGLIVAIRDLSRPAAAEGPDLRQLEASWPRGGAPGSHPAPHDADADEAERRAMAA
jgi:hypothetical protein